METNEPTTTGSEPTTAASVATPSSSRSPSPKGMKRSLGSRVWGFSKKMMRLSAYFAVVSVVSLAIAGRIAYGRAKDVALSTGEDLIRLTEAGQVGDRIRLRLNGELVLLSSASTDAPVEEVLDHFQGECQEHADGIVDEFTHLRAAIAPGAKPIAQGWPGVGLLRKSEREYGVVLCFAQGRATTTDAAYKHVAEFAKTGDLSKIGSIRYVVAQKTDNGTHVVALSAQGTFQLKNMFPDHGDAPGNDPKHATR